MTRSTARSSAKLLAGLLVASAGLAPAAGAADSQIIAGSAAPTGSWPSIAHIDTAFVENGAQKGFTCGGTVIAPHWILTAAHCTYGDTHVLTAPEMTVVTGRTDLTATGAGQSIQVAEIIRHAGYRNVKGEFGMDIALLRLGTATSAPRMEVATQSSVASYSSPANVPNAAGWGLTNGLDRASDPTALREAYLPLRTTADCATFVGATWEPSNMVCTGSPTGQSTCSGDSGGPLVVFAGGDARRPVLWGITSFGATTCNDGVSVFARVAAFTTFLAPALAEIAPAPAPAPVPAPAPAPAPATAPAPAPAPAPVRPSAPGTPAGDRVAPSLSRFRIPATVLVRRGRAVRPIRVQLRSSERATIRISLLRRQTASTYRRDSRSYQTTVRTGTSRMTLPRALWTMKPGSYALKISATDASGNSRTWMAAMTARRAR